MAVKKETPVKAAAAAPKAAPATKTPAKAQSKAPARAAPAKKPEKGTTLECEVCGMALVIDELCDCVEVHEIICCEEPMKPRTKASVKARPKAKAARAKAKKAA